MRLSLNFKDHPSFFATGEYFLRAADRLRLPVIKSSTGDVVLNIESGDVGFAKGNLITSVYRIDTYISNGYFTSDILNASKVKFSTHPWKKYPNAKVVMHATDPSLTGWERTKKYDVVFCGRRDGGLYDLRNSILSEIEKKFNHCYFSYGIPTPEYLDALGTGKIIVQISTNSKDVNRRVFDAMALGVLVTNDVPDLHRVGKANKHYLICNRPEDVQSVISEALDRYEQLHKAGKEHVLANHTYDHRLEEIYTALKEAYDEKVHKSSPEGS